MLFPKYIDYGNKRGAKIFFDDCSGFFNYFKHLRSFCVIIHGSFEIIFRIRIYLFMHSVKWPNILLKYCGVHTARFFKCVWPFYNMLERVNCLNPRINLFCCFLMNLSKICYVCRLNNCYFFFRSP